MLREKLLVHSGSVVVLVDEKIGFEGRCGAGIVRDIQANAEGAGGGGDGDRSACADGRELVAFELLPLEGVGGDTAGNALGDLNDIALFDGLEWSGWRAVDGDGK